MDNATPHGSSDYDEEVRATIPYYELFHRETLGLAGVIRPEPEKWLDTGCGTGFLLETAADKFPGCMFFAADPSKGMMDACREKLAGKKNIVFLDPAGTGDLSDGRLSGVDVITAIQSHHYLDREGRRAATENCFKILKRGGAYITFENVRPGTASGIQYGLDRWGAFQRDHGRSAEAVESPPAKVRDKIFSHNGTRTYNAPGGYRVQRCRTVLVFVHAGGILRDKVSIGFITGILISERGIESWITRKLKNLPRG